MKNSYYLLLYVLLGLSLRAQAQQAPIIPRPAGIEVKQGSFVFDETTSIQFKRGNKELEALAQYLAGHVREISGYTLPLNKKAPKTIELALGNLAGLGDEGYQLQVSPTAIVVKGNTRAGVFYGLQSLRQSLPAVRTNAAPTVPAMEVIDSPRFAWRGMMLDVSRHFYSIKDIKEILDLLALYKINTFQWHLTDNEGWRLESKKYPRLTTVGTWRLEIPGSVFYKADSAYVPPLTGKPYPYGGYYTQEQVREVVAYARVRNITVIPEIEMPGHSGAALAAYPRLACTPHPQPVPNATLWSGGMHQAAFNLNYCPANDSVFVFLADVLDEVMTIFPGKYIHIGGDEVDKADWKKCARCQALITREGLKDEDELQSYFLKRIAQYVVSKGRRIVGWDEILEGGLAPGATVMSWRGERGGIAAAKQGHDVVMTPGNPVYFDQYQAGPEGEPLAIGGFNTLKRVYDYEPVPKELTAEQASHVLGAQGNLWAEYITTVSQMEYMVLPRMLALAEVVWSPKEKKSWEGFNARLPYHYKGFGQRGLNFSPGNYTVAIQPISQNGSLSVALSTEVVGAPVYYTLDGSVPTLQSTPYASPIPISSSVTLKAVTAVNGQVKGVEPASQSFAVHKAIGRNVAYATPVSKYYQAEGPNTLTDGVRGSTAVGKHWHGLNATNLVATVDLGTRQAVSSLTLGCLQNYPDWIFMPQWVKFEVSTDGTSFKEVGTAQNQLSVNERKATIRDFTAAFPAQQARYVRVTAKNLEAIPKGHPGEGKGAWIFADEIIVK